jgi:hypothetical protein
MAIFAFAFNAVAIDGWVTNKSVLVTIIPNAY